MKRVISIDMEEIEEGVFQETEESIKRRISDVTGFDRDYIVLAETLSNNGVCTTFVTFSVMGKGFWTDFKDWDRSEAFDTGEATNA